MHRLLWLLPCAAVTLASCGGGSSPTTPPPQIIATLSASSLTFANTNVGASSAPQSLTLTNNSTPVLTVSSITATGPFSQTNNCPASLSSNVSCTIDVTFTPASAGASTGSINVSDNASNSPQTVSLSGTGITPPPPTVSITSPTAGAIVGGVTMLQANVGGGVSVQFQVDGINLGTPVGSPFSYPLQTTQFSNGTYSLSAVATNSGGVSTTSQAVSIEIINLGQFRMSFCTQTGGYADWMAEINFTQAGTSLSANSQSTLVYEFDLQPPGCSTYEWGSGSPGPAVSGTISGDTASGSFSLAFTTRQLGPLNISGVCFDSSHLSPTYCVGPYAGPLSGNTGTVTGNFMAPFSGTFSGTLSYETGSETLQVTLSQNTGYVMSASYTDTTGPHTLSGQVVGGTFSLPVGFDGNNNTGVEICTGPVQDGFPSCSTFEIWMYDANWNFLGTLK
jgi:Bacterial Ig domain/Abnormal spindle-like microcephaly-assoc'd, ASPM-SPD-2-Hydin